MMATVAMAGPAIAGGFQKNKTPSSGQTGASVSGGKSAAIAVVKQFEEAYKRKDKTTMIQKLMIPTEDAGTLEKRYQWLRGYGPKDLPGSVHPPILFDSNKGSFVPTKYAVTAASSNGAGGWNVTVTEEGTYRDEDGRYRVSRVRRFKIAPYKGKYYVADYFLKENAEDYGFYVDDISDKMVSLGK
jgi:hypothetical protein